MINLIALFLSIFIALMFGISFTTVFIYLVVKVYIAIITEITDIHHYIKIANNNYKEIGN